MDLALPRLALNWTGSCADLHSGEDASVSRWFPIFVFIMVASCQQQACPSLAGDTCNPRNPNCPQGYTCAISEICTKKCEQTSDCWIPVSEGCRSNYFPGQRLPDGGTFVEVSDDGFCPQSKELECIVGYCQLPSKCGPDGCDYDLYGPSHYKGAHE